MAQKLTTEAVVLLRFMTATQFPHMAPIIYGLVPVEVKGLGTFATDYRMRWYYDPDMGEKCSMKQLVACLLHECYHHLFEHHDRGKNLNGKKWNIAGDLEINDGLCKEAELPDWVCFPKSFQLKDDEIAEWYYGKLPDKGGKGGAGAKGGPGPGEDKGQPQPGGGNCGSGGGGEAGWWETPVEPGKEYSDGNGVDPTTQDFYRRQVAEEIIAQAGRGTVPGDLERWAKNKLKNKVNWLAQLRATVANSLSSIAAGMVDYTYARRNRRQESNHDFIMQGFFSPEPVVGVILDTSGSMGTVMVDQGLAEIGAVLKASKSEVIFVDVDSRATKPRKIRTAAELRIGGGGGTDMREGYKALAEGKAKPDLVICITDGDTPWPDAPIPHTRNIVVLTTTPHSPPPHWAKVVQAIPDGQ